MKYHYFHLLTARELVKGVVLLSLTNPRTEKWLRPVALTRA